MPITNFLRKNILPTFRQWRYSKRYKFSTTPASFQRAKYATANKILGFSVKEVEDISELNLTAVLLEHKATGAEHLHLSCDDPNNLFWVMCRTPPLNSKGVPHILEHLALCGSRRFPCRDPFMNMRNRSLATFMNAFTGSDITMYGFSSQNSQDFQNLLHVYLDAVFFPLLNEKDFRQEGWRLEHENINDKTSPIIFKGVVFNEMKGVFADPNQYYAQQLQNLLFPCNTYQHCSGGNPLEIPHLSWKELKAFHAQLYHPSNSRFVTYGNMPLEHHLETIESLILDNFEKIEVNNIVPDVKKWKEGRQVTIHNRSDPMAAIPEKQTIISESFVLDKITNTKSNFAMSILCTLLINGPNSPFYQKLLESGIGPDYSPYSGFDGYMKQSAFSIGLREISSDDVSKVQEIISQTFDEVIKTGFPEEQIKAVLHTVELGMKHRTSNFGLNCAMGVSPMWNHGGDPIAAFRINDHVKWFVDEMEKNPHFLQDKIVQYFKNNKHKITLIMTPKENFEAEEAQKEKTLLETKLRNLTNAEKLDIYEKGLELSEHQKMVDISCLPSLQIEDVKQFVDPTPLQFISRSSIPIQLCEQPTNEVVYFRGMIDVSSLPSQSLMLLPLLCTVLTQMGAGSRGYKEFDQEAQLKTSGLRVSFLATEHPSEQSQFIRAITFSSYCLEKYVNDMFTLWKDIFTNVHLTDGARFSQLVKQTAAEAVQGLSDSGHQYALRKAAASLSPAASLREVTAGILQLTFLKQLAETDNHQELLNSVKALSEVILQNQNEAKLKCSLNATPNFMPEAVEYLDSSFLSHLTFSKNHSIPSELNFQPTTNVKSHFILPLPVNFLGQTILTVPFCHKDFASLKIVAKLLSFRYLHNEIREKGGAYGGGASLTNGGHFMLYSYRDPNFGKTLEAFSSCIDWVLNSEFTDQDINESKLGVFGELDSPVPPGSKGKGFFHSGITDEMKNNFRAALLKNTRDDLLAATHRHLKSSQRIGTALIGPENQVTSSDNSWKVLSSSM